MIDRHFRLSLQVKFGLLLLGCSLGSMAQKPSADAPPVQSDTATIHVTTRLVILDVVVMDKAGHPVSNLDQSQFTVTEDKVPQTIRSFDPPSGHEMPEVAASHPIVHSTADLRKIGNAPVNILVFDELNTKWEDTGYARSQMQKYLKAQPEVLAVPTLLLAAGDSKFMVLHDYTQSRAELEEAVRTHFPQYPWQMMRSKGGNGALERMGQTLGALSQIAESSRGTPGRKNVIWVGSGYPSIDTTNFDDEDQEAFMTVIRRVTGRMLAARVTLYMVDPAGVVTADDTAVADADGNMIESTTKEGLGPFSGKLDFGGFAVSTGGSIFSGSNDVNHEIGKGLTEGGIYYTLSYVPTNTSDDAAQYRQIHVKLKDPSLHAVTRDGYFSGVAPVDIMPIDGKTKPAEQLKFDIVSAAQTRLVYNGLRVAQASAASGFELMIGAKELHWTDESDGNRVAELTVMTVFFSAKDKPLGNKSEQVKERISTKESLDGRSQIVVKLPFEAPKNTARIRFVVRDAATGTVGTADGTVGTADGKP